jgi:phosphonate metabolism protein (transferase hexapeptide repeat family)
MKYIDHFPSIPFNLQASPLSEEPTIHPTCKIKESQIGAYTFLAANTWIVESSFGDYSYTAGDVQIIYSEIGKFCSIANSVRINPGNHPQWRVTQHHMTYRRVEYGLDNKDDDEFFEWRRSHKCQIGHDAWIGHGAIIMPGISIGIGAIVGAGAVVTKNIGPYEVAVGVPAKVIKTRFPDDMIEKILRSGWWNWDRATLKSNFNDLLDMGLFLNKHGTQTAEK